MTQTLPLIERETAPAPTLTVIWLHGLGADGNDFVPIIPELKLPADAAVRFIFPTAPQIPVTINGGYVMPAWYDILSLDGASRQVDDAGIRATREAIRALIAREQARGTPAERIVLAGFSQGGAMAYTIGLTHPERLAGIIALSCYLPAPDLLRDELSETNRTLPVFAAHGRFDDIVPVALGEQARDSVAALGADLTWHDYGMPHSVCLEEIEAIGEWLTARL
ncbi:alpha/beta hydrolase [Amnimonas aquatica]|uniref:Carboxylesterase n=1 Tax=Amnimonas aquatica TaxID=2094561 RepID=A0A2P6AS59_9GAMM|nr:alpha/beta hydrolase [Amnimonas aquatica]PQA41715.1 carboxylesterase [Amnimonas aquatica]